MSAIRPRVLYIVGMTRCGSTMMGNVLNEVPDALHIGELHYLWRNGVLGSGTNTSCGCGNRVDACPVWSRVLASPDVPSDPFDAREIADAQLRLLGHGDTAARLAESSGGATPPPDLARPIEAIAAVYRVLHERDAPLIVDGSKYPAEAAALAGRDDLDLRVLHMVRDPRATVTSYRRSKSYIDPMPARRVAAVWAEVNRASERLGEALGDRFLQVRHEDFGADPRGTVDRVLRFAGLAGPNPVDTDGRVDLHSNHTVTGNPDRLERGERRIACDERWRSELGRGTRAVVALTAGRDMRRYGYGGPNRRRPAAAGETAGRR